MLNVDQPNWHESAACRGHGPDLFFMEQPTRLVIAEAKAVCSICPVRGQCLQFAMDTNQIHGIWGGLNMFERRKLKAKQQKAIPMVYRDGKYRQIGSPDGA